MKLLPLLLAVLLPLACGPAAPAPRTGPEVGAPRLGPNPAPHGAAAEAAPAGPTILVHIRCTPPDAQLSVDGRPLGPVSALPGGGALGLPPGLHRFEFTRAGRRPFRIELKLADAEERLQVTLPPAD